MTASLMEAPAYLQRILVGVGDLAVSSDAQIVLSTYALGSCVGVVAYDPLARAGGILHLMLPDSEIAPDKAVKQPAMFADTGLALFFQALRGAKAVRSSLQILVAGGANVLYGADPYMIGERNTRVTMEFLSQQGYAVRHTSLGGAVNRALHLEMATGSVMLKTPLEELRYSLSA